ncbi:MAG: hypothetical protein AYP45_08550 [Candidatus Brocadia carolinensis]|uniref:Uncharacterized protein n=1 Tax=Candidatus Brocadia carolinensis TaxID=1004156 RepID=A0A1V4ATQ8_9BACT|nr:MAG: hypothetical protein AYP45_08550 [Candidatus Brocadia caroliniensis]
MKNIPQEEAEVVSSVAASCDGDEGDITWFVSLLSEYNNVFSPKEWNSSFVVQREFRRTTQGKVKRFQTCERSRK